jgi:hypothetical protein
MTKEDFDGIIDYLLKSEITITMGIDSAGNRRYDLNTQMKSGLTVSFVDGEMLYEGRYDVKGTLDDLDDLFVAVRDCMYGRDYACPYWIGLLVKHGRITVKTETTTKTTYS